MMEEVLSERTTFKRWGPSNKPDSSVFPFAMFIFLTEQQHIYALARCMTCLLPLLYAAECSFADQDASA